MAWGATEIAELKERVARIAPDNVPRENATPQLFTQFEDRSSVQAVQAAPVSAPQTPPEAPSQKSSTLELNEAPLSDAVLDAVKQTPKSQPAQNIPGTVQPVPARQSDPGVPPQDDGELEYRDALGKVERDERTLEDKTLNLERKAGDGDRNDPTVNGYRVRMGSTQENEKAKARKKGTDTVSQLSSYLMMQNQLDRLYADINRWEQENEQYEAQIASWERDNTRDLETIERNKRTMEENRRQIEDINQRIILLEQLRTMRDAGTLDPDNPDHADMLRQAGVDPEEYKKDPQALEAEIEEQEAKKEALETENDALKQDIEQRNAAIEDAKMKIEANKARIKEARAEIAELEERIENDPSLSEEEREALRDQIEKHELEKDELTDENGELKLDIGANAEQQVESFMKAFAALDKIEDPIKRLEQEKLLVENLSPEAVKVLEKNEDTKQVFGSGYFAPLEGADMTAQNNTPAVSRTPVLGG